MGAKTPSERLEQLLRLARAYRGWTRKQLAEALGRDSTRLVPESGNPKLDLVLDLAKVMDWPVEDVARYVGHGRAEFASSRSIESSSFQDLADLSRHAHREGRYRDAIEIAQRAHSVASSGDERAIASVREASAWDGLGRYTLAMDATRRGLSESGVSSSTRTMLQINLAIEHYTLWQLVEANAIAHCLLDRYAVEPAQDRVNEVTHAHALYVRGHSHRRIMGMQDEDIHRHALHAKADLQHAADSLTTLAKTYKQPAYLGVANTCNGGLLEVAAALGEANPSDVIGEFSAALDKLIQPDDFPRGDELESYGWWCIFGCNVALRHVEDPREVQRIVAMFTNKADEIAVRLDNWSLRERVFSMDYERRQRFADWTGMDADWTIDKDDLRVIAGTMGRFPGFRRTGWQLIESSTIVSGN